MAGKDMLTEVLGLISVPGQMDIHSARGILDNGALVGDTS
jgi:hypothetical protein